MPKGVQNTGGSGSCNPAVVTGAFAYTPADLLAFKSGEGGQKQGRSLTEQGLLRPAVPKDRAGWVPVPKPTSGHKCPDPCLDHALSVLPW